MNSLTKIILIGLLALAPMVLNAKEDCYQNYVSDISSATAEYIADLERCGRIQMCTEEASLYYTRGITNAYNRFLACV